MARIKFMVDHLETENGQLFVCGRCGEADIHLGDDFTALVWRSFRPYPETDFETIVTETTYDVRLRIDKISCYRRYIELLSRGWTAGLCLSGEGMERLRKLDFKNRPRRWFWHVVGVDMT